MDSLSGSSTLDAVDFLHSTVLSLKGLASLAMTVVVILLVTEAYRSNYSKIAGIPELPGALPFVGHLLQLGGRTGDNDATVFSRWSRQLGGAAVFQCVLGNQRTVVVQDWATMRALWVGQANALIDRPHQPGFVDRLGIDLTGSCMTDQVRKCRAAGMRALGKPNWPKYYHLLEPSSAQFVRAVAARDGKATDTYAHLRRIVFDLCLSLTYGARFGEVDDASTLSLIGAINAISAKRSSTRGLRAFVPLLRLVPEPTSAVRAAERVRRRHRDDLLARYRARVAAGETVDCIVASLQADRLTEEEVHGTCLSLLQAAPDTVASAAYMAIAWLASPQGRDTQAAAHAAVLAAYDGDRSRAWRMAFREERVPLVTAVYKETLRFFTLAPYATPRRTVADVVLPSGVVLPKGVTLIMNAQAVDHDEDHFGADAWQFRPDRYLAEETKAVEGGGSTSSNLPHVAFGAGSRICPAVNISNRLISALLTRLLLAFDMENTTDEARRPVLDAIHFSDVADSLVAHPRFYDCHFRVRDPAWLDSVLAEEAAAVAAA